MIPLKELINQALSKTLRKEGSCGYNRSMEGKKLTTPGGLKETIEFVAENYSGQTQEEIVQEVARRVSARLIREKKKDAMANKLAERIYRRLASK